MTESKSENSAGQANNLPASVKNSWWQTLPGVLTAIAGLVTAIAGLFIALHQAGLLGSKEPSNAGEGKHVEQGSSTKGAIPQASEDATATSPAAVPKSQQAATSGAGYTVAFPAGTELKFRNNRSVGKYQVLAAQVERRGGQKLLLKLSIRLLNEGAADVGFWSDSFRLVIDGVPRASLSWLNTIVDARSAKDSELEFEFPKTAKSLSLQVLVGDQNETGDLPISLQK